MAAQGHEFASLTYDLVFWHGDLKGVKPEFRMRTTACAFAGREFTWDGAKYSARISRAAQRMQEFTGRKTLPVFRAPVGKASPRLLEVAGECGYAHVRWADAGLLGDELASEKFSNKALLEKALCDILGGDILIAHLGSGSRKDP